MGDEYREGGYEGGLSHTTTGNLPISLGYFGHLMQTACQPALCFLCLDGCGILYAF
jgi:hypothetical protein